MGALSGTAGSVVYFNGIDNVFGEIREWSLDLSATPINVTAFGDTSEKFVQNLARATGAFSGNLDPSHGVQGSVRSDFLTGANVRLLFYYTGSDYVDAIKAHITGISPTVSVDGKADLSYDFQVTGVLDTSVGLERLLMESADTLLMEDGSGVRMDVVNQW